MHSNCITRSCRTSACSIHRQQQPGPVWLGRGHICQHLGPSATSVRPAKPALSRQGYSSSSCSQTPRAVSLQHGEPLPHSHHLSQCSLPHLPTHGSLRGKQRQPTSLTSRASRLTPPSASLAFAEPATAVSSVSGAAAGAATAAGSLSFSKVLAVVLGYCVMAGSLFRSVPQIVKVIKHNSTEGLSLMSYIVELCCYSVVIAYNLGQVGG